ncbi:hypothetical protein [Streptomyces sp. NPDC093109]|uniref:hypothetical protein n=1 Tax=Streptomyces sp. NPDC093109 TaxID=3154977 RepID=UPI00344EA0F6
MRQPTDLEAAAVLRHYEPLLEVVGLSGADAVACLSDEAASDSSSDTPYYRLMDDIGRRADRVGGISQQGRTVSVRDVSEARHTLHRRLMDLALGVDDVRQGREEQFGIDVAGILAAPHSRFALPDDPQWRLAAAVPKGTVAVAHAAEVGYAVYGTYRRRKAGEALRAQKFWWDRDAVPEGVWRPRSDQSEEERHQAVRELLVALTDAGVDHAVHGQVFDSPGTAQETASPAPEDAAHAQETEAPPGPGEEPGTEAETAEPAGAPDGPDTASRGDGRVRLTSADGRLTFTLLEVPGDQGLAQQAVEGYQRRLGEFTAVVEAKNEQAEQTPAEQADQLARWRRTYKGSNLLEPFRPPPSLRLPKRADASGLTPAEYGIGSWVTWRDEQSDQQMTGQVMSPGEAGDTWYVSTDLTGHTGEYHVLSRSGKKATGYTYSINGAAADLRPADGPGAQLPWAPRAVPESAAVDGTAPPADAEQSTHAPAQQETATQVPPEVAREALQGGNRIAVVVSGRSIQWDGEAWGLPVPETVTVTGTVYPGYRDYRQNSTLLDAVILDRTGKEVTVPDSVFIRQLPSRVQLIPAEHRDDLRPETRTVAQVRLGDLIAEGGTRGESVTELRFVDNNRRGSVIGFSTRDVATGAANGFALDLTEEVLVVPRERRAPQDVAAVFGRHNSRNQVALETRRAYDLHAAATEVTSRVWPDGSGPQGEIQALSTAIGAIDVTARGVDAYRANAAAMEAAGTAAAALFAATADDMLNRYVGVPLHRLRQHLDVQVQRLHADVAHLIERAAAAPTADTNTAAEEPAGVSDGQMTVEEAQPATDTISTTGEPAERAGTSDRPDRAAGGVVVPRPAPDRVPTDAAPGSADVEDRPLADASTHPPEPPLPAREEEMAIVSETTEPDPASATEQLGLFGEDEASDERTPAEDAGAEPAPEPGTTEPGLPAPDSARTDDETSGQPAAPEPGNAGPAPDPALPVEDPPVPDLYAEDLAAQTPAATGETGTGTDDSPSPPETAAPDRTEETPMATPTTEPVEAPEAAPEPSREETASGPAATTGGETAAPRAPQENAPRTRPDPPTEEPGGSLGVRARARAVAAPPREQQGLPLWTGTDLPTGAWRQENGVLYDAYGAPQWRLKTDPGADSGAQPRDTEAPADDSPAPEAVAYEPVGIEEAFAATVAEAWADIVPPEHGTVEDLLEAVDAPLRELEEQWRSAVPVARASDAQRVAPTPVGQEAEATPPRRDPGPVNEAMRQADDHAAVLRDLPEWQRLQTVRGATTHLWNVIREKAGDYFEQLSKDIRVQGFWRTVSIRTTTAIATGAQALADVALRGRRGDELPTAEALLNLGGAARIYSTPGIPHPGRPAPDDEAAGNVAAVRQLRTTLRTGAPVPYGTREDAVQASREVARAFQAWRETPMGQELTAASAHPRVVAFREAWQRLPLADLPDGPGTAAGPYGDVGRHAQQLAERAGAAIAEGAQRGQPPRFAEADVAALRTLAALAEHHGGRLAVTLPPGLTGPAAPMAAAPQRTAPRPKVAAPAVPAATTGSRGMSA